MECLLAVLICVCYRFGVISPGHQAILFRYCHVIICHRPCIYINSDICTSLLSVYICRYHLLSSFFFLFFYLYEIFKKKKKEKLISNFNVRVKKNVFISVNKYTYIYILYIWNYIFFRCGRIFLWYIPMYIYIYNMGATSGWSVTHHAVTIWFSLFRMLYHFRFRFYTILNCTRWFLLSMIMFLRVSEEKNTAFNLEL